MDEPTYRVLADVLEAIDYREGWEFHLVSKLDPLGQEMPIRELQITAKTANSYRPEHTRWTTHCRLVPPATYNWRTWARWVFAFVVAIETHEACEFFQLNGDRPFAPHHGDGEDPYSVFDAIPDISADDRKVLPGQ